MIPLELKKLRKVGRSPRLLGAVTAADAPVGLRFGVLEKPDQGSGADEGVRPTNERSAFLNHPSAWNSIAWPTVNALLSQIGQPAL
jgi:hypothetical protein